MFAFCSEPGTPAAELDGQLPEEVKQDRRDRLMAVQQEIAFAWNASQVGRRMDVMIDRRVAGQAERLCGPELRRCPRGGRAGLRDRRGLRPGQIVACEVVAAQGL